MNMHPTDALQLRPRDLTTTLFADALDGDANAEADLLELALHDPTAEAAHAAIIVAEMDARFRDDQLPLRESCSNRDRHTAQRST